MSLTENKGRESEKGEKEENVHTKREKKDVMRYVGRFILLLDYFLQHWYYYYRKVHNSMVSLST